MATSSNHNKSSTQDLLSRQTHRVPPEDIEARREYGETTVASGLQSIRKHFSIEQRKETPPHPSKQGNKEVFLERVPPRSYELSYAFLLIPRFSSHYLMGDICDYLREWMQQICISFGWRLDDIIIRREYLQWLLRVPPATSPSYCVQTIRKHTSTKIFEDFPHYKRENLSKDFWAPGYLPLVGTQLHPMEMIKEYINQTRQQQGIPPRRRE